MKKQRKVFLIHGAIVFADAIFDDSNENDPIINLESINEEYRYGMLFDGLMWASKNAEDWVLALAYGTDAITED